MTNKQKANEVTGMAEDRGLRDKSVEEMKAAVLKRWPNALLFGCKDSFGVAWFLSLTGKGSFPLPQEDRKRSIGEAWADAYGKLPTQPQDAPTQAADAPNPSEPQERDQLPVGREPHKCPDCEGECFCFYQKGHCWHECPDCDCGHELESHSMEPDGAGHQECGECSCIKYRAASPAAPTAAGSEEPKPLSPTAYTLGRAHTCPKCEHSNIPCPENRRAAPVASQAPAHPLSNLHALPIDFERAKGDPRQDDARAWIVCATEHPDPSRREEAVSLIAEGLAAICDRSTTDDRRGIASLDEHGWTPIKVPSRPDIKAARLVAGKVQFHCYNKALCEPYTLLDASLVGQDVLMYLEASYWQQRCFALEKERDEFERKGKDLCSAYGESLIKVADLEAELKALKGAAE